MVHTVRVGREGKWWTLAFPDLGDDAISQSRRYVDIENDARDYLAVTLDVPRSTLDLDIRIDDFGQAAGIQERSDRIIAGRRQIEQLENEVSHETAELARELSAAGVSMRDIAALVGVSFQRVGQLVQ